MVPFGKHPESKCMCSVCLLVSPICAEELQQGHVSDASPEDYTKGLWENQTACHSLCHLKENCLILSISPIIIASDLSWIKTHWRPNIIFNLIYKWLITSMAVILKIHTRIQTKVLLHGYPHITPCAIRGPVSLLLFRLTCCFLAYEASLFNLKTVVRKPPPKIG